MLLNICQTQSINNMKLNNLLKALLSIKESLIAQVKLLNGLKQILKMKLISL